MPNATANVTHLLFGFFEKALFVMIHRHHFRLKTHPPTSIIVCLHQSRTSKHGLQQRGRPGLQPLKIPPATIKAPQFSTVSIAPLCGSTSVMKQKTHWTLHLLQTLHHHSHTSATKTRSRYCSWFERRSSRFQTDGYRPIWFTALESS